jgi:hypothetical protein
MLRHYRRSDYALASFAGFRFQPELLTRAQGKPWTDQGPALGALCSAPLRIREAFAHRVRCTPPSTQPAAAGGAVPPSAPSSPPPASTTPVIAPNAPVGGHSAPPPTRQGVDLVVEPFTARTTSSGCTFEGTILNAGSLASRALPADATGLHLQVEARLSYDSYLAIPALAPGGRWSFQATVAGHDCSGYWLYVQAAYGPWNSDDADLSDNQRAQAATG